MKVYGYTKEMEDSNQLLTLSEISIQASPKILREIAAFILKNAEEIEKLKESVDYHTHLRDHWSDWQEDYADIIIVSE